MYEFQCVDYPDTIITASLYELDELVINPIHGHYYWAVYNGTTLSIQIDTPPIQAKYLAVKVKYLNKF